MFNLTKEENRALVFLFMMLLIGLGIDFSLKTHFCPRVIPSFSRNLDKIDLNKADKVALMSVKGIGEKMAGRIIDYRVTHNGFDELDRLKDIKGITESKYERIKESFYIE